MASKEKFINWIQDLGPLTLQNEAEVETKFIIPLFQHLGHKDECRRDKYPIKIYSPGKKGRKPEIDLVYFSVDSPDEQNSKTSLVIVEAKEPGRADLEEDLAQAKFYAYNLKSPFLVLTNGRNLIVVRQHTYSEEEVFNGSVESLKTEREAAALFEQLNYQTVKELKDNRTVEPKNLCFENYAPPVPGYFCGRDEELAILRDVIRYSSIIVVGGIAGIGKSYLAAQFVYELREMFSVIWLSFEPQTSLEHFLGGLAQHFKNTFDEESLLGAIQVRNVSESERIKVAVKLLDNYSCLLVWDNFSQSINRSFLPFLTACSHQLENGRLLITTKEWFELENSFNVPRQIPPLTSLKAKDGIELMQRLGVGESRYDVLRQAHEQVGGHPKLLTLLTGLSKIFPLIALLEDLPHVPDKVNEYIQQKVFDTLEPDAQEMLKGLSLLEVPFQLSVINHLSGVTERFQAFENLANRFLVTRLGQQSEQYEIHELVKTFCRRLSPVSSLPTLHRDLYTYYKELPEKQFIDATMLVHHALNGELEDEAYEALKDLLFAAFYKGMYDFILEYTSTLFEDERIRTWGFVYFFLGRVLRFKERYADAKEAYEAAFKLGRDIYEIENAKFELASVLTYLSDDSEDQYTDLAKKYFAELRCSSNHEIQLKAIAGLGTLSLRERNEECISELEEALSFAEQKNSWLNTYQLCICLGQAYIDIRDNDEQGIVYLERSLKIQREHENELGAQTDLSLYITSLELAKVYGRVKRFAEEVNSWKACVEINRRLGIMDRLAETLFYLGCSQLDADDSHQAKDSFNESITLISEYKLEGLDIRWELEWLAVAEWGCGDYERAIEYVMEAAHLSETQGLRPPVGVVREVEAPNKSEITRLRERGAFILVLPSKYSFNDIKRWSGKIKQKHPEFRTIREFDLHKKGD